MVCLPTLYCNEVHFQEDLLDLRLEVCFVVVVVVVVVGVVVV